MARATWVGGAALVIFPLFAPGCAAVYPEVSTPMRDVTEASELEPPPPDELLFIHVRGATIPKRTRDGREWDEVDGTPPDPFVIVYVDKQELFRTPVQKNTLRPVWKEESEANYRIPLRSEVRLDLWDKNAMQNRPICQATFRDIHEDVFTGSRNIDCESGARIRLDVANAKPKIGLGMKFEIRPRELVITRVYAESPASRAELRKGQRIVSIEGKPVAGLSQADVKSLINANAGSGVEFGIRESSGATKKIKLQEGPIYPVAGDGPGANGSN